MPMPILVFYEERECWILSNWNLSRILQEIRQLLKVTNLPFWFTVSLKFFGSKHSPDAAVKLGSTLHQAPRNSVALKDIASVLEQPRTISAQTRWHGERAAFLPSTQRGRNNAQSTALAALSETEQSDLYMFIHLRISDSLSLSTYEGSLNVWLCPMFTQEGNSSGSNLSQVCANTTFSTTADTRLL